MLGINLIVSLHHVNQGKMDMCLAIAAYNDRIASLFETAEKLVIVRSSSFESIQPLSIHPSGQTLIESIQLLKANNVKILICGAIRECTQVQIEAQNIQVIPWITGEIEPVIHAFSAGNLFSPSFLMPGCRDRAGQRRQRFRGGRS